MTEVVNIERVCSQPECDYNKNGICIEGNGDNCQFLDLLLADNSINSEKAEESDKNEISLFRLRSGKDIQEKDLSSITYNFDCNLIVLIGEPACGKSTLFASIFDRFQKGHLGNFYFSQTQTPISFEERAHHARLISQNKKSLAERTKTKEFAYLHLGVRSKDLESQVQHLLFADVNGEKFQDARNNDEEMQTLTLLKRANHIFFIADGEALLDRSKRQIVKSDTIKIIQRVLQNRMISKNQKFNLIITKWDKIHERKAEQEVESFLITPIFTTFADHFDKTIKIASRSQNEEYPAGTGLEEFIVLSLTKPMRSVVENFELSDNSRQFQKFKYTSE